MENVHSIIVTNQELRVALVWYPNDRFIYVHAIEPDGTIALSYLHCHFIDKVTADVALTHIQHHLHALLTLRTCTSS